MSTFRDNEGRAWTVRITVERVRRLREELEFNLLEPAKYREAVVDPVLCARVVYRCLFENATRNIEEADFLDSIHGDVIDRMRLAFDAAVVSFFPSSLRAASEGGPTQTPHEGGTTSSGVAPESSA